MPITKDKKTDIMLAGAVVGALGIGAVVLNQPKPEPVNENTNDENAVLETGNKVTNAVNDAVERAKVEAEAQEKARLEAEEKARIEAEAQEKARLEAEEKARAEAEERARLEAQRAQQTQQSAPVSRPATTTPARTQSTPAPAPSTNTQSQIPTQKQAEDDAARSKFAPKSSDTQNRRDGLKALYP